MDVRITDGEGKEIPFSYSVHFVMMNLPLNREGKKILIISKKGLTHSTVSR